MPEKSRGGGLDLFKARQYLFFVACISCRGFYKEELIRPINNTILFTKKISPVLASAAHTKRKSTRKPQLPPRLKI